MNVNEVYDALRWLLREAELRAFVAALEIVRAQRIVTMLCGESA